MIRGSSMAERTEAESDFLHGMEALVRNNIAVAATFFRRAVEEDPLYVDALFNLGKACKDLERLAEAADAFQRITSISPEDAEAWYMLGNTRHAMEMYHEAEGAFRNVLRLHGDDTRVSTNLGVALQAAGKPDEALVILEHALRLHPENADLHYNRALSLLLSGEFEEGWREFEWRFQTSDRANPLPQGQGARWQGEPVVDKTLLLVAEQGVGDTIQFARYIPEVRRRCRKVVVECQPELIPLMRTCEGIDALVERDRRPEPVADVWAPLMSLPLLLGGVHPSGSDVIPYFAPNTRKVEYWRNYTSHSHMRARVGLVWAGNPRHKSDKHRSCATVFFTPLIKQADVAWFSLQKGKDGAFPAEWNGVVTDVGSTLGDFGDTAAAIESLDLIITVDTAVAHLAGAIRKPVWLLLPFAPDWRWMLARPDSPWYPTMRIFRQPVPGDWHSVIADVSRELQKLKNKYDRSLSAPGNPAQYLEYANALREAGLYEHALRIYRLIVQLDPSNLAAWNNLGITLQDGGNLAEATDAFRNALAADPSNAVVMNNLGFALLEQGNARQAEEILRRGIASDPSIPDLHNNLGNALKERGALEDAKKEYRNAIAQRSGFPQAHWNLAQVLLQTGELTEGWLEYESRWLRADFTSPRRNFRQPEWAGENLTGRTLLVHSEQGFGDALHFVRYVPMIALRGATVVLECHPELERLFSRIPGVAAVVAHGSVLPEFDMHVPMMSLPRIFGTTLTSIPTGIPYLSVAPEELASCRSRLGIQSAMLHVGFTWSGMRHLKALLHRACPLDNLMSIFNVRDVEFYSLQKSPSASDVSRLRGLPTVRELSGQLNDFADTAAVISNLDLVISVDTSVAHLAGALGIPTWVLLPQNADWRWLIERTDSPWYPTMRLFRQRSLGEWKDVLESVGSALGEYLSRRRGDPDAKR
jgi:tetratricopeptide (TPR) repeat protein